MYGRLLLISVLTSNKNVKVIQTVEVKLISVQLIQDY